MRLIVIYLFFINHLYVCAQNAQTIFNQIDEHIFNSQYDEAISIIDKSNFTDSEIKIRLANKKCEALIRQGKLENANTLLQETLKQCEQSKNKDVLRGITLSNIGFLYLNQGRNDLALNHLQESSLILQQKGSKLDFAQALAFLGQVYWSTGKYTQAEEQLLMSLALRKEVLPSSHELIAASYNDLGLIYLQLDVDKAIDYYEMAAGLYEKLHGKEHPKMAIANTNLGLAYLAIELYGDAINYFESALAIWNRIYPTDHPSKAFVLTNLARTYSKMGNTETAMQYYDRALSMYKTVHGSKHPDVASTLNLIGNVLLTQQKYQEALTHLQQALVANVPDFNSVDFNNNPDGQSYYNGNVLLYSLMYKAQVLEAQHFGKTLKQSELELALNTLQIADGVIDRLRQQSSNESDKIALGTIANEVYADGVRMAFILGESSIKKQKSFRELSFYFAEKSKSAVLLDAISETNAKSFAGIPEKLLDEESRLKSELALISQKLAQKPGGEEEQRLRSTAYALNQQYQSFIKNLEVGYPEYFNLKFNSSSPKVFQIQTSLDPKSAIISYFIDEKNNRLYRYLITKKKFTITDKLLPGDYEKLITGLRNSLYYLGDDIYIQTARELEVLLIPKLPHTIHDLILLPTGRLSVIPFEVLLTKNVQDKEIRYESLPYLIKRTGIRYEFSAGLLLQKKQSVNPTLTSALLCAPVNFDDQDNLDDLPGTEKEVNTLNDLFTRKNIGTQLLLGKDASEESIKSNKIKDQSLIHLATHGIVDESQPELSRIFLSHKSGQEDGSLYSGEIYNLRLNADLVTLSACQTGLGKISKGEGVIGLSRALVYAGANKIIVSFWNVADESTAELMTDFYRLVLDQPASSYSRNLQQAKLNMIKKSQYSAPFYWAPFILIGY